MTLAKDQVAKREDTDEPIPGTEAETRSGSGSGAGAGARSGETPFSRDPSMMINNHHHTKKSPLSKFRTIHSQRTRASLIIKVPIGYFDTYGMGKITLEFY